MSTDPSAAQSIADDAEQQLGPAQVYERYADFVWRSLQRCGVSPADLEDALQDVFVVVHRKLGSFRGDSKLTTWLFGICLRVAKKQRRFAWFRSITARTAIEAPDSRTPERDLQVHEASREIERILARLSPDQRAVLTMFEIEQIDCSEIAKVMGIPLGTVYSRLHAARARFRREYERAPHGKQGAAR